VEETRVMMTENSTPTAETGGPGVGLSAEERNGRGQMLDEKSKKQTRDGFGIPGLLAEPTGTDGFPVLCHQFALSSLPRLATCISRSNTFWKKKGCVRVETTGSNKTCWALLPLSVRPPAP